jgi:O-antigen/teichoic acid export membrane protein
MNEVVQRQTSKSVFRSVIYGLMTWIAPLAISFIATPIIVRNLGNSDYGIYALVLGFISYSFAFNLGRAATKYIAEYRLTGETEKIRDVISASFFLNLAIGGIGVTLMCLSANWLVRMVFNIEPDSQAKATNAIYIAAAVIFLWMLNQVFTSVLLGLHRFDVYAKIFAANSFLLACGNLTLAYLGYGLLSLLLWNCALLLVFFVVYGYAAKRLLPELWITTSVRLETVWLVLRYSSAVVATQILANALLLFERGLITHRLGSESLTYYVVPMSIGLYLHGFISSLVQVVFPLASELKDERGKMLRLYSKATKVVSVLVVFAVVSLSVESVLFLRLWMGESFAENSADLLVIHVTCFGLVAIMSVSWQMTEGLGFPQLNAVLTGICTAIGISLMLILSAGSGNFGFAIARLGGFATIFFSIFVVEKIFFKEIQLRLWSSLIFTLGCAGIAAATIEYFTASFMPANWATFLLSVVLGGSAYCLILWILDFVADDERLLLKQVLSR